MLDLLDIEGDVVSIDTMECQNKIAAKIIERKADYILAIKGNQSTLESDINHKVRNISPIDRSNQTDMGHGRIEIRTSQIYRDFRFIEKMDDWKGLTSCG